MRRRSTRRSPSRRRSNKNVRIKSQRRRRTTGGRTNTRNTQSLTKLRAELREVPGVGAVRAHVLIKQGVRDVRDLLRKPYVDELSEIAKLDLTRGINRRIAWATADQIAKKLPTDIIMVGSYRRGKPFMGDMDVITLRPLDDAENVISGIARIVAREAGGSHKRILVIEVNGQLMLLDLFYSTREELPAALLAWTGPQSFNIRCRAQAKRRGYTLNQYGLFKANVQVPAATEREILTIIGVTWKEPADRK